MAFAATTTDNIGSSLHSPAHGILTTPRPKLPGKSRSPLPCFKYRRRQLELRKPKIKQWTESDLLYLQEEDTGKKAEKVGFDENEHMQDCAGDIEPELQRQE